MSERKQEAENIKANVCKKKESHHLLHSLEALEE